MPDKVDHFQSGVNVNAFPPQCLVYKKKEKKKVTTQGFFFFFSCPQIAIFQAFMPLWSSPRCYNLRVLGRAAKKTTVNFNGYQGEISRNPPPPRKKNLFTNSTIQVQRHGWICWRHSFHFLLVKVGPKKTKKKESDDCRASESLWSHAS